MASDTPLPRPIGIEEFTPLVGETLQVECDPSPVELHLVSATPLVNHAKLDRPPFLLILRSAPAAWLVDGGYVVRGKGFGPDQIHIQQIVAPADSPPGRYYQAVFN